MAVVKGLPTAADVVLIMDKVASIYKAQAGNLGLGAPGETATTLATKALAARDATLGDGGSNAGIANEDLKPLLAPFYDNLARSCRMDVFLPNLLRQIFLTINNQIQTSLPPGFSFAANPAQYAFDLWMMRLNANGANVPAAPTGTPSLSATTGGSIPSVASGNAPRVKVTYTSGSDMWKESQPSAASTQVALSGSNSAYSLTLSGTAPITGYMNVYRQLLNNAGSSDPYYLDQRVTITGGAAFPSITLKQSDQMLRLDYQPPVWLQCLALPEFAALWNMAFGTPPQSNAQAQNLLTMSAQSFLNPSNVAINPVSGIAGYNNPASTMQLGQWVATVFTAGVLATLNDATNILQGFAGAAGGVQARVTSALNSNASLSSIGYTYYDATNPTMPQAGSIAGPLTLNSALGSTVSLAIPAGRLVTSINSNTVGTATTGTFIYEAIALRSI